MLRTTTKKEIKNRNPFGPFGGGRNSYLRTVNCVVCETHNNIFPKSRSLLRRLCGKFERGGRFDIRTRVAGTMMGTVRSVSWYNGRSDGWKVCVCFFFRDRTILLLFLLLLLCCGGEGGGNSKSFHRPSCLLQLQSERMGWECIKWSGKTKCNSCRFDISIDYNCTFILRYFDCEVPLNTWITINFNSFQ